MATMVGHCSWVAVAVCECGIGDVVADEKMWYFAAQKRKTLEAIRRMKDQSFESVFLRNDRSPRNHSAAWSNLTK